MARSIAAQDMERRMHHNYTSHLPAPGSSGSSPFNASFEDSWENWITAVPHIQDDFGRGMFGSHVQTDTNATPPPGLQRQPKTCSNLFPMEWVFLILSTANILAVLGFTLERFIHVIADEPRSPDFTFTLLLVMNALFCLFYVYYGVFQECKFELYALQGGLFVLFVYCGLDCFVFGRNGISSIKLVRMVIFTTGSIINSVLAYILAQRIGYLTFFSTGASDHMQRLHVQASLFTTLLKSDLQAACSVTILALKDGTDISQVEIILLAMGITLSLALAVLGWIVLKKEAKRGAYFFAALELIKPACYLYSIITECIHLNNEKAHSDNSVSLSLIITALLGLHVWGLVMYKLKTVTRNFGRGLRLRLTADENTWLLGKESDRLPEYTNIY